MARSSVAIAACVITALHSFAVLSSGAAAGDEVRIVLGSGRVFPGRLFTRGESIDGEIVFTTALTSYVDTLTDPSYYGQIIVSTFPQSGAYGTPDVTANVTGVGGGLLLNVESSKIHARALIVTKYTPTTRRGRPLAEWLESEGVLGVEGVDTRELTTHLRTHGTVQGVISTVSSDGQVETSTVPAASTDNWVAHVSLPQARDYGAAWEQAKLRFVVLDCGLKLGIVRELLKSARRALAKTEGDACIRVVPWNFDLTAATFEWDGLLIGNGPGDPSHADLQKPIRGLGHILQTSTKPTLGVCLGHQLIGRALGASTYKLKFGHRSHNQPVLSRLPGEGLAFLTSQNHGYAVNETDFPSLENVAELFQNLNDGTNEGLYSTNPERPFFSAQFHPEASGGPRDTFFLMDTLVELAMQRGSVQEVLQRRMKGGVRAAHAIPTREDLLAQRKGVKRVLLLGSGATEIGQAGEFDYAGSQAIKALKEESEVHVILVNPNVASVQTARDLADEVFFTPLTAEAVARVVEKARPDALMLSFGGQTALNVGVELEDRGVLKQFGVRVMGTPIEGIIATEDRDVFGQRLHALGEPVIPAATATTLEDSLEAAERIGYPVLVRSAFALGGAGSGFARDRSELESLVSSALAGSPQVQLDRSIRGWKEFEYEVVRDYRGNCITVCNMENIEPVGVHTGESSVVAPSLTLSDREFHMLRDAAIRIVSDLGIIGECNIQFALPPAGMESHDLPYAVIEVNPRLSRSSALASKATGYPLAFVAAKLALGYGLDELPNAVNQGTTKAFFEPALDYVVVKLPRWDLAKFDKRGRIRRKIDSAMKSVGEVMAIGRHFPEAFQKALRMRDKAVGGFEPLKNAGSASLDELMERLNHKSDEWLLHDLADAIYRVANGDGITLEDVGRASMVEPWFLLRFYEIAVASFDIKKAGQLDRELMARAKQLGFSDGQIAARTNQSAGAVRSQRKEMGIVPSIKQIDTLAAEYPAHTNYLYMSYHGNAHDVDFTTSPVIVLGSGGYRIGSSVEFDYSVSQAVRTLRSLQMHVIVVNFNPETVSTDYDESDRLYFEELSFERVLDIAEMEHGAGVIVSMGGQDPQNLALPLHRAGVRVLGTDPRNIDRAEDREKHSALLQSLGVDQPEWRALISVEDALAFADRVGYPVLVRPSYVLSGAAMNVARSATDLGRSLTQAAEISPEHPVVLSKFYGRGWVGNLAGTKLAGRPVAEVDVDAVALHGRLLSWAVCEHMEPAGVHSGDATLTTPPQHLSRGLREQFKKTMAAIAGALNITGAFNIQALHMPGSDEIKVIETNLRASRSLPFVSKAVGVDFAAEATRAIVRGSAAAGKPIEESAEERELMQKCDSFAFGEVPSGTKIRVGVKSPKFSWRRVPGSDPGDLGVDMRSTGEVAAFASDAHAASLLSFEAASGRPIPTSEDGAVLSVLLADTSSEPRQHVIDIAYGVERTLEKVGYKVVNVSSTAAVEQAVDSIRSGEKIGMVLDYSATFDDEDGGEARFVLRRTAADFGVYTVVVPEVCEQLANAIAWSKDTAPAAGGVTSHLEMAAHAGDPYGLVTV